MRHGSSINPKNRFERIERCADDPSDRFHDGAIEYLDDDSQTIVSENRSPDIGFRYSVNPYRGCIHGCSYCYARPTHEYLGLSAGLDFETKIIVKQQAPALLRRFLARKAWAPEPITFSGVTDCYQPAERRFQLTRQCIEVARQCRQPIGIVTKNALVTRDLDLLAEMSTDSLVHVYVSITTLDAKLARDMEPRTSIPAARLRTIRELVDAGVPVGVMVAPVIPGLNDSEIPAILKSARDAGAVTAAYLLLRLPLTVETVFCEWLERTQPSIAQKVIGRMKQSRDGKMYQSSFHQRMVGTGEIADQIKAMFQLFQRKYGFARSLPERDCSLFRPPAIDSDRQDWLF